MEGTLTTPAVKAVGYSALLGITYPTDLHTPLPYESYENL
jgi:hypothetical protein